MIDPTLAEKQQRPDWQLFVITLILLSLGVTMVYDSSYLLATEIQHDGAFYFKKQVMWAAFGLFAMWCGSRIRFWKLRPFANVFMGLSLLLLVAVRFIGHGAQGAQRWIGYGQFRLQPSEFAKFAIILYLAHALANRPARLKKFWAWNGLAPVFGIAGVCMALVERQPDLGTAITMLLTVFVVLCAVGVRASWIAALAIGCVLVGTVAIVHNGTDNYRYKRLTAFLDPNQDELRSGYQIIHSTVALGTGGATGMGFGESREKRRGNLPAQRTDFIFAIIGEEFGLIGTGAVLLLFLWLTARGLHIAAQTKDPFGATLATGITAMVSVQALVNIGVVSASIPATGVPLPFISYGGSSLVPTLFAVGVLLNISRFPYRVDPRPSARRRADSDDAPPRPPDRTPRLPDSGGRGGVLR